MGCGIASPANDKNIKHRSDARPGMSHQLLIIQPSYYRSKADRTVFKARHRSVVPLTLPYLAALTPADWEVTLLDEQLDAVPFDGRFDLVAISSSTLNSFRAYDIADEFRRRARARHPRRPPHLFPRGGGGRTLRRGRRWRRRDHLAAHAGGRPWRAVEPVVPGRPAAGPGRPAAAALRPAGPAALPPVPDLCRHLIAGLPVPL